MNTIQNYFQAERATGLLFTLIGLLAIAVAVWGWRQGTFWRGAAWPLALIALVQIGVGASGWLRSPTEQARVLHIVAQAPQRIATEEIPRMQAVLKSYGMSRPIEVALVVAGLLLAVLAARGGTWQGVGAGMAVQVALILLLDGLAERRGHSYLAWLQTL